MRNFSFNSLLTYLLSITTALKALTDSNRNSQTSLPLLSLSLSFSLPLSLSLSLSFFLFFLLFSSTTPFTFFLFYSFHFFICKLSSALHPNIFLVSHSIKSESSSWCSLEPGRGHNCGADHPWRDSLGEQRFLAIAAAGSWCWSGQTRPYLQKKAQSPKCRSSPWYARASRSWGTRPRLAARATSAQLEPHSSYKLWQSLECVRPVAALGLLCVQKVDHKSPEDCMPTKKGGRRCVKKRGEEEHREEHREHKREAKKDK